ncbi:hypothetical protein SAMN05216249_11251 [Acetitomaculum ruminis DSM 5522]|uniref:O-antigen ligase like membrane protein n=1 Tax=Acetitomaculum ruminis DSM 5522 TaxID=1120918 RepID=A0A1I0Z0F4_9FIRM|nr:hypothetical protein [Acetitomaculum ruminis]SFB19105.1 hypothetical protein SAMN05216249_11251 [Acetitomaculum ruminis DSM 5522]
MEAIREIIDELKFKHKTFISMNTDLCELKHMKLFFVLMSLLIIGDYVMPQYFGIHIKYDLTTTRFMNLLILAYFMVNGKVLTSFIRMICYMKVTYVLIPFVIVIIYTTVLRTSINTFFLSGLEILTLYMLIYGIRYVVGVRRTIKWSVGIAYFFAIYGMVEYIAGQSLFLKFLATVPTDVKNCYRSGHYRIMGPCGHPLGYGLLLLIFIAIACIDYEKDEIFLFKRPLLIVLLFANIVLTGSRSTLGIVFIEFFAIILFSNSINKKKSLYGIICAIFVFIVFELVFYNTSIGRYVMMQLTSVIDHVFETSYSANFGADLNTLENSENYRKFLPRIFTLEWLNPFVGRGVRSSFGVEFDGVYIHSIDNYYVGLYIKYAYPGMIAYILFFLFAIYSMLKKAFKFKSGICASAAIGSISYYFSLYWVDTLQTLKYEYLLMAIFFAYALEKDKQYVLKNNMG